MKHIKSLGLLVTQYLLGQGIVQLINIIVGIALLRVLPIEEFALYTLSIVLMQVAAVGSDMGLSQAINTFGAPIRENKKRVGSLFASAIYLSRRLYFIAALTVSVLALFLMSDRDWLKSHVFISLILLLVIVRTQVSVNFKKSVLNVNHDAKGLFQTGISEAVLRLIMLPLCVIWPFAIVAILGNMIGALVGRIIISRHCQEKITKQVKSNIEDDRRLKEFIFPLMPVIIYHSIQGQIAYFLLGLYGFTVAIAEVGALARLGQLIGLLVILNGFLIQPIFSRITDRKVFIRKGGYVLLVFFVFSIVCMSSVFLIPHFWLYILGPNYVTLKAELPIAVLIALVTLLGATLYTLVISRKNTSGQFWYIFVGLFGQILYLSIYGVSTTYGALLLNLIPVVGYACVQSIILAYTLCRWKAS